MDAEQFMIVFVFYINYCFQYLPSQIKGYCKKGYQSRIFDKT